MKRSRSQACVLICLLGVSCQGGPAVSGGDEPAPIAAGRQRADEAFSRARALARSGFPSRTPELDGLVSQIQVTTPELKLTPLLSEPDAGPPQTRLRPGDLVEVTVYGQERFSGERRIGMDGQVHLFLLGAVKLGGLTPVEAAASLKAKLERSYLKQAQVLVWIKDYAKVYVEVIGRVREPGTIELPPERLLGVHAVLARAQGLQEDADGSHLAVVRRKPQGGQRCFHFSHDDLVRAHLQGRQAYLQPDDQIIVPRLPDVFVVGAVVNEGPYPLRANTTVATLISLAGGVTEHANERGVQLMQGDKVRVVDLGEKVSSGAVVFVPQRQRVYLVGAGVSKNGPLDLPAMGLTVVQAVAEAGWFTSHANLNKVEILRYEDGRTVHIPVPVEEILDGKHKGAEIRLKPGDLVFVPKSLF